ncbi:MAG: transposase-like protein [Halieaceae bacterium]|jgi:transposase-like protein
MNTYKRRRFPPDIIPYAVWLYYRFNLKDFSVFVLRFQISSTREDT